VRFFPVYSYLIVYQPETNPIEIFEPGATPGGVRVVNPFQTR